MHGNPYAGSGDIRNLTYFPNLIFYVQLLHDLKTLPDKMEREEPRRESSDLREAGPVLVTIWGHGGEGRCLVEEAIAWFHVR